MNAVQACAVAQGAGGSIGGTNEPASTGRGLRSGLARVASGIAARWRQQDGRLARGLGSRPGLDTGEGRRNQADAPRPLRAAACAWMVGALLVVAGMVPTEAIAQTLTERTFLDNGGVTSSTDRRIERTNWHAQEFTTGSQSDIVLTKVELYFTAVSDSGTTTVRLLEQDSNAPTVSGAVTLTSPTLTADAWNVFTAPARTTLTANTTYYIEVGYTNDSAGTPLRWDRKNDTTSQALSGWSLGGYVHGNVANAESDGDGYWTTSNTSRALAMRIKGTANHPPTGEVTIRLNRRTGQTVDPPLQVGETLVASFFGVIQDEDGLPGSTNLLVSWNSADNGQGMDSSEVKAASIDWSYGLESDDVDMYFQAILRYTDGFGKEETVESEWIGPVLAYQNPPTTGTPIINFTSTVGFRVGTEVTIDTSDFADVDMLEADRTDTSRWAFSYYRYPESATAVTDPSTDAGAVLLSLSGPTITLPATDDTPGDGTVTVPGGKLVAAVTATDGSGDQTTLYSALSSVVLGVNQRPTVGANFVTGTLRNGSIITINTGEISDPNGTTDISNGIRYELHSADDSAGTSNKQRFFVGSNPSYQLTNSEENKYIQAVVVYTDDEDTEERAESAWLGPVMANDAGAVGDLLINRYSGDPSIDRNPERGETLSSNTDNIMDPVDGLPFPVAYRYQWQTAATRTATVGTDIAGATGASYTLTQDEVGKYIRVTVEFEDDEGNPETKESFWIGPVVIPNDRASGRLTISGTAEIGQTLTATPSNITDGNGRTRAVDAYQWQRLDDAADTSPDNIGAGLTYTLVAADEGNLIRIVLTFTDDEGFDETIASDPIGPIGEIMNTLATGEMTISGTAEAGRTLTATPVNIDDANGRTTADDTYQWQRLDSPTDPTPEDIGDGSLTYMLVAADVGKVIRIVLTFTDDLGFEEAIPSDPTAAVLPEGPPEVTVTAQNSSVNEGENAVFQIRRTGSATGALTVRFTIDDRNGALSSGAGQTSALLVAGVNTVLLSLPSLQDSVDEPHSTVLLTIQSHSSYTLGRPSSAAVVVRDDDGLPPPEEAPPAVRIAHAPAVDEGQSLVFPVSLNVSVPQDIEIEYAVSGAGVEAADFGTLLTPALTGTITILASQTSATLELAVLDDAVAEQDETVQVRLTRVLSGSATLQRQAATGVIRDNNRTPPAPLVPGESPTLAIANAVPVDEGGTLSFDMSLNGRGDEDIEVEYRITGAGIKAADFFLGSLTGTVEFRRGQISATLALITVDDAELEDNETVEILFTRVVSGNVTLQASAATGVIRDNDVSPDALAISDARTVEGGDLVFVVALTRSPGTARAVTVDYSISGGTALLGADYSDSTSQADRGSPTAGRLLFTPDVSSRNIVLFAEPDYVAEGGGETVEITLANQSEGVVFQDGGANGEGVISETSGQSVLSVRSLRASTDSDFSSKVDFQVAVYPALDYGMTVRWKARYATADAAGTAGAAAGGVGARTTDPECLETGVACGSVNVQRGANLVPQSFEVDGRVVGAVSIEFEVPERTDTGASVPRGELAIRPAEPDATDSGNVVMSAETSVRVVDPRERGLSYVLTGAGRSFAASVVDELWGIADMHAYSNSDSVVLGGRAVSTDALAAGDGGGQAAREIAGFFGVEVADPYGSPLDSEYSQVTGGGLDSYRQWADVPSIRDLQDQSRFALSLDGQSGGGTSFLFWGGAGRTVGEGGIQDDDFAAFDYENEVSSSHLGLGFRTNRFMMGVAFSRKESEMEYQFAGTGLGNGEVTTSVASVTPHVHVVSENGNSMVWGAYSAGTGTTKSKDDRAELEMDIDTQTVAAGLRNGLITENEGSDLSMRADIFFTSVTSDEIEDEISLEGIDVNAYRMRAAVERESKRAMTTGASVITRMGLGGRVDGGDAETGIGAEVSMQFGYIAPDRGLSFRGGGSALVAHEEEDFKQWSLGFGLEYAANKGGRGLQLSLKPTWNASLSGDGDTLWASSAKSVTESTDAADGGGAIQMRLGYGAGMLGEWALATVYGEAGQADEDRSLRLGAELRKVDAGIGQLRFDLYGQREESAAELPDHTLRLEGRLGF